MFLYILPTILITALSIAIFVFTFVYTSPQNPDGGYIPIDLFYFFITAFLSLAGTVTLVLYWLSNLRQDRFERRVEKIHQPKIIFRRSLRHGILVSATLVGIGLLNALNFANPLNIILLITAFLLIEFYFFGH